MGECLVVRSGGGIDTSNSTATSNSIVSGYSCYVNDELVNGDIPTIILFQKKMYSEEYINLDYGYYDNTNLISVSTLEEETAGDCSSSDILESYSGWISGKLISGTVVNRSNYLDSIGVNTTYTIPRGWYVNGTITQKLSVQSSVTVVPTTANRIACAANRWVNGNIVVTGDEKLVSGNIKNGVTIFGARGTFTGWVDNVLYLVKSNTIQISGVTTRLIEMKEGSSWFWHYWIDIPVSLGAVSSCGYNTIHIQWDNYARRTKQDDASYYGTALYYNNYKVAYLPTYGDVTDRADDNTIHTYKSPGAPHNTITRVDIWASEYNYGSPSTPTVRDVWLWYKK